MTTTQKVGAAAALLLVGAAWGSTVTYLSVSQDESPPPKQSPHLRVSGMSTIGQLQRRVDTEFRGVKYQKTSVMWQAKDGTTQSEASIFGMYQIGTPKLKAQARKLLKKSGLRRVVERCGGIIQANHRWSFGICTYSPAPTGPDA